MAQNVASEICSECAKHGANFVVTTGKDITLQTLRGKVEKCDASATVRKCRFEIELIYIGGGFRVGESREGSTAPQPLQPAAAGGRPEPPPATAACEMGKGRACGCQHGHVKIILA